MFDYLANYQGTYPVAFLYVGQGYDSQGTEIPNADVNGYIHWSAFIYGKPGGLISGTVNASAFGNQLYATPDAWQMFQCPSLNNGGLPPANTSPVNQEIPNDAGSNVWDFQAPRLGYTVNEAICPWNVFQLGFQNAVRVYHYVRASQITNASQTILATEWNGSSQLVSSQSRAGSASAYACKSHRPVSAFRSIVPVQDDGTSGCQINIDQIPPDYRGRPVIERVKASDIHGNPDALIPLAPTSTQSITRLDWVGRNHGIKKIDAQGRDVRLTNFLYVDGHVETKSIFETITPWQWGDKFFSLTPNGDVLNTNIDAN
jgi:prepilin-type processing-associated H-X9-DG protein